MTKHRLVVMIASAMCMLGSIGWAGEKAAPPARPTPVTPTTPATKRVPATPATPAPEPTPAPPGTERAAYEAIKNMIYDAQYRQAQEASVRFLRKYARSVNAEEVSFWNCYALQRATRDLGGAFDCYQSFLARYPAGSWSDDARAEYVKIAKKLARAGDPRGKVALDAMQDSNDEGEFKLSVIYALLQSDDPADAKLALDSIQRVLKTSKDPDLRRKVIYLLADSDDPSVLDTLIDVARTDPDADVRRQAIYAISGQNDEPRVVDSLVGLMKTEKDPDLRRHVLYALAQVDRPDVIKVLSDAAQNDADAEIRTAATYAIAEVDDPAAVSALKSLLQNSSNSDIQRAALYALVERDDVDIVPELKTLALSQGKTDAERELRRTAVYALAEADGPTVEDVLAEIARTSSDDEIKKAAFYALAEKGGPKAQDMLKSAALDTRSEDMARAAVYALGDMWESDKGGFLLDVYRKSPFESVRRAALETSVSLGGSASALGEMLKSEKDPEQRRLIVRSLADIETDESVEILTRVARTDSEHSVRREAVSALGAIDTPAARKALRGLLVDGEQ